MNGERRSLTTALEEIEKAEERRRLGDTGVRETRITMSHGSGGTATKSLIDGLFVPILGRDALFELADAAVLPVADDGPSIAFTTDTFVVRPLFFPGGDIGRLAVHGTVNDLAVVGARPVWLSLGLILEEGLPMETLERVVRSIREAADAAGVEVVTGDTKVVEKGKGDGVYVNTTGVGLVPQGVRLSPSAARPGDQVLLSGSIGEHGVAVLLAREDLDLQSDIVSDTAALHDLTAAILEAGGDRVRCMRDATRGGVAAALNEIASRSAVGVALDESAVGVRPDVRGACELLGIDPLHMANEGRLVAFVAPEAAGAVLEAMRAHPRGTGAAVVGEVVDDATGTVFVRTALGGSRVLDMLVGDALPRIC